MVVIGTHTLTNITIPHEHRGLCRGIYGVFALLEYYTAYIGSYRRFGTSYRSHLGLIDP